MMAVKVASGVDLTTVDELARHLLREIDKQSSGIIFAANATGKTRLSQQLSEDDPDGVVLYNSYVEDLFVWDDDQAALKMNLRSSLFSTIEPQGLDKKIVDSFMAFTDGRVEPSIDFARGEVRFGVHTGDSSSAEGIKISRAEESIFIWCVYYTVLQEVVDALKEEPELRSTGVYDTLKLAVIDDPVSSMDDMRVVSVAMALADTVKAASKLYLKFVITTHHALFFNVLFNALNREKSKAFVLHRGPRGGWKLELQLRDAPFSYHLDVVRGLERATSEGAVNRAHINQFRSLLEKTANFLGYEARWSDLLTGPEAQDMIKILNLYSHDRLSEVEPKYVSREHAETFGSEFEIFLRRFRWQSRLEDDIGFIPMQGVVVV